MHRVTLLVKGLGFWQVARDITICFSFIQQSLCSQGLVGVGRENRAWYLCERYLPLTTLCVDNDEEVVKVLSSSLTGIVNASIRSS